MLTSVDKEHSTENYQKLELRKNTPYLEFLWSVFPRIRTEYGEIRSMSPYSVRMWENNDQKNSEYGHFSLSVNTLDTHQNAFRTLSNIDGGAFLQN